MWNNKRTVTSLPSAFRLLTSRRGEQICAPVQRKDRHAALSPGSHFGTSPSIPVPGSGVGGDSRLLSTTVWPEQALQGCWGGGQAGAFVGVQWGGTHWALSSEQTPLGFSKVGLDHSRCAKLDLAGDPCIPSQASRAPTAACHRFPRHKSSGTNPKQDPHSQAVQAQTP